MALSQDVVRRLSIVATEQGLTAVNTKLREHERLQSQVTTGAARMATATEAADRRMQAVLRQRDRMMAGFNQGGVAGLLPSSVRSAGSAVGAVGSFAINNPAAIVAGITAVIAAYSALNAVWGRGAELLERYANAHRSVDRSDLTANLEALTKFQTGRETFAQAQYATELGVRLQDARFTLDQFFKVQMDITNSALKLQSVWVRINELMASVVSNPFFSGMAKGLGEAASGLIGLFGGSVPAGPSREDALAAARGRLGSALDTSYIGREGAPKRVPTFAGQFNDVINQLSQFGKDPKKEAEVAKDAWDRAIESARKHIAVQEAETAAVGQGVGVQAQYRMEAQLTEAAERAGVEITGKRAVAFTQLAERARAAATALGEARLRDDAGFDLAQLGRTDSEAKIASQLRGIYGNDYASQMDGTIASQLRFNDTLRQTRDLATEVGGTFFREFRTGLLEGEKAWDAFSKAGLNALNRIADKLLDMITQNLLQRAVGSLGGLFAPAGGGGGGLGGGVPGNFGFYQYGGQNVPVAIQHQGGMVGMGGTSRFVHPAYFDDAPRYHRGGIAGLMPDEVPAILQRGETVTPRNAAASGPQTIVNIHNAPPETTTQTSKGGGGVDIVDVFIGAAKAEMARGGFNAAMAAGNSRVKR